jgi:hypothetical protein
LKQCVVADRHITGVAKTGIAFRPIGGGDKVLRVEMSSFAPEPASLPFSAIGEMNR